MAATTGGPGEPPPRQAMALDRLDPIALQTGDEAAAGPARVRSSGGGPRLKASSRAPQKALLKPAGSRSPEEPTR